mmetsp:Transcript_2675/g.4797  ORF Transcript_2675/g.4797 Transcript_2675/m.4797 type:complete len:313 (-) Transcript_2675:355-1293(-)|eukprot:CAMPEP_0177764898 /NCGR_PEP_ID=MMETSP0491_2-20121128/7677_1 /TAXON_ID=63592 /ORGANISM="Tetraselmis chuii, Strain PLY429" /LENGTH=312 /DNA_ID=CAMNT_0019281157 /DNA_START=243 /DNA_END=1181 /DNA_ORIENTATION=-
MLRAVRQSLSRAVEAAAAHQSRQQVAVLNVTFRAGGALPRATSTGTSARWQCTKATATRAWEVVPFVRQHYPSGGLITRGFSSGGAAGGGPRRWAGRSNEQVLEEGRKRSTQQALYLTAVVVGMVGITYASVPLYRMFCQATGFGGTVQRVKSVEEKIRDQDAESEEARAAQARVITVDFNADVQDGMPWKFRPTQRMIQVKPGESALAFYTAHNTSDKPITGVSTYNVSPQAAGLYFNKIQCFCFEEQLLRPGEKIDMPVFFYIDPEFASDPRLKGVENLTLSYTFFEVEEGQPLPQLPQPGVAMTGPIPQ